MARVAGDRSHSVKRQPEARSDRRRIREGDRAALSRILSHSERSAITGSIRVARRAGNHDAHSVTNSRRADSAT